MLRRIFTNNIKLITSVNVKSLCSNFPDGSKDHINKLVSGKKLVVFMKGTPDKPLCGFSNAVIQILKMHGVNKFDSHDVLQNEDIRQG